MKKLALALVCLVSVAFFASCDPEVTVSEPSIQVYAADGYVKNGDVIDIQPDTTFVNFGFTVASNSLTNKGLASLVVKVDDNQWANVDLTGETSYTYKDVIGYLFTREEIVGNSTITAVVTDEAGKSNTATIQISFNQAAQPLEVANIEWIRRGTILQGDTEADMAKYGLQWTGSYKEIFATIKPVDGASLYVLEGEGAEFVNIKTNVDKAQFFANLNETHRPDDSYRGITTAHSSDPNDLLAIVKGENTYLVRIKHAEISTGSYGTQITIIGDAK